jgi:hypothetical protein
MLCALTGLVLIVETGLTRSMTDQAASRLFVTREQALHLAEAGADETMTEWTVGGADGIKGNFSVTDGWLNASTDPGCQAGMTCRRQTFTMPTGGASVVVLDTTGTEPSVTSVGNVGSTRRTVNMVVSPKGGLLPILGATTVITNESEDFELHPDNPNWVISGYDNCGSAPAVPGITTSTDYVRDYEVFPETLLVPDKVIGAPGDFSGSWPDDQRSVHSAKGDPNFITAENVMEFVGNTCSHADYYFRDGDPQDRNSDPNYLNLTGGVKGMPAILGTPDSPKITCLDNPTGQPHWVRVENLTGAGILVVNSDFDIKSLNYRGLIVIYGEHAELSFNGTGEIQGAVIVAATGNNPVATDVEMGDYSNLLPSRRLLYCSTAIASAANLFGSRTGSISGGVKVQFWHAD